MDATIIYIGLGAIVLLLLAKKIFQKKAAPATIEQKLAAGAYILDVRSPGEFSSGAYPKAKNIPLDTLASRMGDLPKNKPIVVYCAYGSRSAQAVQMLKSAGFSDVVSAGGLGDMPK